MRNKGSVRFFVGCDLEEFRKYYRKLGGLHDYFRSLGIADVKFGELGPTEEHHISRDPSHLIVWREGETIIGHAIWHEESIDSFSTVGDKEIRGALDRLLGERRDFVELHEIWLEEKHRGKGYGNSFFEFFENLMKRRRYDSIIYFTGHPAAMAICRRRRYNEVFLAGEKWHIFQLILKQR
jgi:GNAT superfamily N-acetyltransferase